MEQRLKVKFYSSFPVNERDKSDPEDTEDVWSWAFLLFPTVKIVHDCLYGKRICFGFLFWSFNIIFEDSIQTMS